jgi:hypothetical protein
VFLDEILDICLRILIMPHIGREVVEKNERILGSSMLLNQVVTDFKFML